MTELKTEKTKFIKDWLRVGGALAIAIGAAILLINEQLASVGIVSLIIGVGMLGISDGPRIVSGINNIKQKGGF